MRRFRIAKSARLDLDEIFGDWCELASPDVAERLIDQITDRFWLISQFPASGELAPHMAPGLRRSSAGKYLIYYAVSRSRVDILHVFHGARDQKKAFLASRRRSRQKHN